MKEEKKSYIHKELASGRWRSLSFYEQMANIGSDVLRAIRWQKENNAQYMENAIARFLELIELTVSDDKNHTRGRLKELTRIKELLLDYFYCGNTYLSTPEFFNRYFDAFAYRTATQKGKKNI